MARPAPHLGRIAILLVIVGAASGSTKFANGPFAEGTPEVHGARLTIYADALTNDADQVLNVG